MQGATLVKDIVITTTLALCGIGLIAVFFAAMERYQVLVAGTETDSVEVTVTVSGVISISSPADVSLSPDIPGTGSADGSATWKVETNNSSGWKLEVNADASPAMTDGSGNSFADYTESTAGVPENWSVDSADSEFGFSASGDYAESEYSSGSNYEGFEGTSKIQVASDGSITPGGGADTTVHFKAEAGSDKNQPQGEYSATITATASTL
ncbi:MAG: hypothetical protein U5L10_05215 [Candidatus Moranbacteria bacterium]|nr:hypothetical protein [Candidatus Moranbacteria bacterium]